MSTITFPAKTRISVMDSKKASFNCEQCNFIPIDF